MRSVRFSSWWRSKTWWATATQNNAKKWKLELFHFLCQCKKLPQWSFGCVRSTGHEIRQHEKTPFTADPTSPPYHLYQVCSLRGAGDRKQFFLSRFLDLGPHGLGFSATGKMHPENYKIVCSTQMCTRSWLDTWKKSFVTTQLSLVFSWMVIEDNAAVTTPEAEITTDQSVVHSVDCDI